MVLSGKSLVVCVVSALVSALAGVSLWLSLITPWPSLVALPFVVSLPLFLCWRYHGCFAAIVTALLSALLLVLILPSNAGLLMGLQLLAPSLFLVLIADLRVPFDQTHGRTGQRHGFMPLSHLIASNVLVSGITTLILAAFFINNPEVKVFFDEMAQLLRTILREAQLYSPQLEAQIALILTQDMAISLFAFYGFSVPLINFYIVGRIERPASQRPGDYWPMAASHLPRVSVALLIVASLATLLPLDDDLENSIKIITMILIHAFILCGLAAAHLITRGKTWRPLLLSGLYVFATLPLVSMALAGLGVFASITPLLHKHQNRPPSI